MGGFTRALYFLFFGSGNSGVCAWIITPPIYSQTVSHPSHLPGCNTTSVDNGAAERKKRCRLRGKALRRNLRCLRLKSDQSAGRRMETS